MPTHLPSKRRPATVAEGYGRASRTGVGVLSLETQKVLEDFYAFEDPAVRAAFAHRWIVLVAQRFEQTWPVLYQLLKQVETDRLYAVNDPITGQVAQPTFQAYWEATTGKSFEKWLELEQTYAFVCHFKPEMIHSLYSVAQKEKRAAENQAANDVKVRRKGRPENSNTNNKDVTIFSDPIRGNNPSYALRRLAKDRPDLHAQCLAGELTANAAMVEAGFRKRPPSRKTSLLTRIQRLWNKADTEERRTITAWVMTQTPMVSQQRVTPRQLDLVSMKQETHEYPTLPIDYLHKYWRAVPKEERLCFLTEMLTPNERRALQCGFEDEEPTP